MIKLIQGDCLEKMKDLEDNSVDAVVTDPPYELGFMGKKWDNTGIANNVEVWGECLRVLKPGGHLFSFGGTRTYHRMACAIEDAGFEIRDQIQWLYGSGFPKSYNISKGMNKYLKTGNASWNGTGDATNGALGYSKLQNEHGYRPDNYAGRHNDKTEITEVEAQQWDGWGTALKPANEPVCLARKPLSEKTIVENVLKWGTGGINVDGCRVGTDELKPYKYGFHKGLMNDDGWKGTDTDRLHEPPSGRFPANLILDEEAGRLLDEQSGELKSGAMNGTYNNTIMANKAGTRDGNPIHLKQQASKGGASRFFYCAKSSKRERNSGLDSYVTVKYNYDKSITGDLSCKSVIMVAVQLLRRAISDMEIMSFSIGESGESIMVQCPKDSLSITLMEISKIIESKILNSLTLLHINEFIADVNCEMGNGGNLVMSVGSSSQLLMSSGISQGKAILLMDAVRNVISKLLLMINEEGVWKDATNFHNTVKPIALMEYLINMISRDNQVVLDPFMGSGTTGIACKRLNRNFIGIELDPEYFEIAKRRIKNEEIKNE